jgi:O-antigen biosynthesis protein WbqP
MITTSRVIIRVLDVIIAVFAIGCLAPLFLFLILLGALDTGSPLFRQIRLGRYQRPFVLLKLRTMKKCTTSVATHLVDPHAVTAYGRWLRRTKMDELPQLWNVLNGDMSLVGPRPGLCNQVELTRERAKRGVFSVRPGVTGLAQVSGIDMSTPELLAETDQKMIAGLTVREYFRLIFLTVVGKGAGDRVKGLPGVRSR